MRNETVTVSGITAVVRSRSRRTAIIEALYKQSIVKAHPEITAYEQAQYALVTPELPIDINGRILSAMTPSQQQALSGYTRKSIALKQEHALGSAYAEEALKFVPILARVTSLSGTAFDMTPPQFVDSQVLLAFEDWLEYSDDEGDDLFWKALKEAVARIDAPLTPVEQRPPEALTEDEKVDPLSVEAV